LLQHRSMHVVLSYTYFPPPENDATSPLNQISGGPGVHMEGCREEARMISVER